ncbi:hypothetical protein [Umezawaea beigongshangensis]|nr:hypothetical protein [Umezawaea beigongshangensis]
MATADPTPTRCAPAPRGQRHDALAKAAGTALAATLVHDPVSHAHGRPR